MGSYLAVVYVVKLIEHFSLVYTLCAENAHSHLELVAADVFLLLSPGAFWHTNDEIVTLDTVPPSDERGDAIAQAALATHGCSR